MRRHLRKHLLPPKAPPQLRGRPRSTSVQTADLQLLDPIPMPDPHLPSIEQALTLITKHQAKLMHLPLPHQVTKATSKIKPLQTIFQVIDYDDTYIATGLPDWLIVKIPPIWCRGAHSPFHTDRYVFTQAGVAQSFWSEFRQKYHKCKTSEDQKRALATQCELVAHWEPYTSADPQGKAKYAYKLASWSLNLRDEPFKHSWSFTNQGFSKTNAARTVFKPSRKAVPIQ